MKNPRSIRHFNALLEKLRTYVRNSKSVNLSWSGHEGDLRIELFFESESGRAVDKDFESWLQKSTPEMAGPDDSGSDDSREEQLDAANGAAIT